ncbi:MAG: glycosyltransferase family 9 protein [Verrucomicrobia bacterium]|nr:glycosyltransferase family 9 protein [Verrucomicrobiota bacterium]NBU07641.1 glycosyltransferase family 9 protein [Pseudomonadota bacterium]NDA65148.1 glycosyltransferase family 9 protein [Verrucomicrobiota bacterium]NDB74195.1 glycosyltransferase family 9 protein [Verrucomicrobiota bacterium]NDD37227.1 glycosyltransferase family 9 protein [Verrucomicrobiota bacterium]
MRRILVYRLGSLGDTVIALPSFHRIRRAFPNAEITVLTNQPVAGAAPPLASVLENTGTFDHVLAYPVGLGSWRAKVALRRELAARRFDGVISLASARGRARSLRDWLFFKSCGIPRVIGVPFSVRQLAYRLAPGQSEFEWEARRLLDRLAAFGPASLADDLLWDLRLTPGERTEARRLLDENEVTSPFLALAVGTKVPAKDWGEARWQQLLGQLAHHHSTQPLVLLGGHDDHARNDRLAANWPGPSANLAGRCGPRVSAAVLERARLFVGVDSGPMHLAACVGVRCVVVFSARSQPGQWFPRGDGHTILYRQEPCFGCALDECVAHRLKCLTNISVAEVHSAVEHQLARTSPVRQPIPC